MGQIQSSYTAPRYQSKHHQNNPLYLLSHDYPSTKSGSTNHPNRGAEKQNQNRILTYPNPVHLPQPPTLPSPCLRKSKHVPFQYLYSYATWETKRGVFGRGMPADKSSLSPGSKSKVKSSVQRALRTQLVTTYPLLAPYIDEIIPKKEQLDAMKM